MLYKIIYSLAHYFPQITTRQIHQLVWIYQRTYTQLGLEFSWDITDNPTSEPTSEDVDKGLKYLSGKRCLYPHRPPGGRPRYMFRWTVWSGNCTVYKELWEKSLLETFKYYLRPENEQELRNICIQLRFDNLDQRQLYSNVVRKTIDRRIAKSRRGGRDNPRKREISPDIPHGRRPLT